MTDIQKRLGGPAYIGIGGCGMNMLASWRNRLPGDQLTIAINRDQQRLEKESDFDHKLLLRSVSDVNTEGDLKHATQAQVEASVDACMPGLLNLFQSRDRVVLLAGLGGVTGTWASQFLCNKLVRMNKQVVTVLVMPFGFESKRVKIAEYALSGFDGDAHRVLCFNDYLIKHTPEHTSIVDAFDIMNEKAFKLLSMPS